MGRTQHRTCRKDVAAVEPCYEAEKLDLAEAVRSCVLKREREALI